MPGINLEQFSGIAPRIGPTELAPNQAQTASNVKLQSGELRPWRKPVASYTLGQSGVKTIYQLEKTTTGAKVWLEWTTEVDVVPSPVVDTTDFRIYYTDGVAPKKTNWNLATTTDTGTKPFPDAYYQMGVPNPTAAPTLATTGGTTAENRAYVYTYISTFGSVLEESGPSPAASIATWASGATVTVSAFATAPTTAAGYNITNIRIYRAVTGATSVVYLYVGTVSVNPATGAASGSFSDNITAANLGTALPSLYYLPPPATLKGLIAMPNGIVAGFVDNQVWFCEPYLPHAWPSGYMMTVGFPIVGMGVYGQTLVVCTTYSTYLISGSTPGAMTQEKLSIFEPCVAKKSIASDQYGVLYASPNGIVAVAPGSADVVTRALFTRDEWSTYIPSSMVGAIYQNMYIAFYESGNIKAALVITRGDTPPLVTLDVQASAIFIERTTANVYAVNSTDNKIYLLDADPINNLFFEWKSKKFVMTEPTNFGALKLQADWTYIDSVAAYNAYVAEVVAANQAIWAAGTPLLSQLASCPVNLVSVNGSILTDIPFAAEVRNVQVIVNADNAQLFAAGIINQEPVRMPAANKNYVYEIKLTGNAPIRKFRMSTSIGELKGT
jgi:hypothetical protein